MNQHHCVLSSQHRTDLPLEVVERVAVLSEDHELLARGWRMRWYIAGPIRRWNLGNPPSEARGCEDLAEQLRQLAPLRVFATPPHVRCERFELSKQRDFRLQLRDGSGGRRLVEHRLLDSLDFVFR